MQPFNDHKKPSDRLRPRRENREEPYVALILMIITALIFWALIAS